MNDSQVRELDASRRSREFIIARNADFPARSRGAVLLTGLSAGITQAEEQAARQLAALLDRQESTEQKRLAINSLLMQISAMNQTARSIDKLIPGIAAQFRMPRGGDQSIINLARAYISAATPIANEFISRGLPATFLADMQATLDEVAAADNHQSAALAELAAATAALAQAFRQLRDIRSELNTIIRNQYRNDPATLAAWRSASRVERAPKRTKQDGEPPPAPPTSTPPST